MAWDLTQVARREVHRINENAESSMIRAGKAVLDAMQQHAMVPEVQKAGSRALFQLASGSASNKKNLYQKDAVNILLKSVENHREAARSSEGIAKKKVSHLISPSAFWQQFHCVYNG